MEGHGRVRISVEAWKLLVAAFPSRDTERVVTDLKDIYPVVAGENVMSTSLNSLNHLILLVGYMLNAGWVDTLGKDFYFY